ncbi:MAG TPA: GxxExxY protein [Candidatus Omnitrophota bacterium]|nr:GxxExxY protein [Candidatus Omnitrophota bacterium]HPD85630.1 GxxExxY protein [Candidatus Omnitrophota bacterium]HRZ04473.1 GxxExxY protein [Candidatus Omnitrophota bacterium]
MAKVEHFPHKELSYKLVGCFYDVYNELGPAHKEQIYHESLKICFEERGIKYVDKPRIKIRFHGKHVGVYEPDFVIDDKIIVEIKSLLNLPKVFEKQLFYYLSGTEYKLGYLVNFGNESIDIRRRIYDRCE